METSVPGPFNPLLSLGKDASEADISILEHQLKDQEPLATEEAGLAIGATSLEEVLSCLKLG
ncbi:MAG: hypothetical protein WBX11_15930 [Thiobacillaceae bacterium]